MAASAPIYFYIDELLAGTWVQLSENLLNRSHRSELTTATGFQDASAEIFGKDPNSTDRTRAGELYSLGLLSGPLVNQRESGNSRSNVPLGWLTIQSDKEVHTRLGYCAYAIGKCLSRHFESNAVVDGLSVIAAICLLQSGVELPGRKWVTLASVFRHICTSFPKPETIELVVWERWLAHGMFATLNDDQFGPKLIDNVVGNSSVASLLIPLPDKGTSPLNANPAALKAHIEDKGKIEGSERAKASLYWTGSPDHKNRPRGLHTLARVAANELLDAACAMEIARLKSGDDSPLAILIQRDDTKAAPCVLSQVKTILSQGTNARKAMENSMKKLSEGVAESLAFLRSSELPSGSHVRVYYAHGIDGTVVHGVDQELVIRKDKCVTSPLTGDIVQYGPHQLTIKSVIDAGLDWKIVLS